MRTFTQFQEDLNSLGHNTPLPPKKQKRLESDKGAFKDFEVEEWKSRPFPKNDSEEVRKELLILQSMVADRDMEVAKDFMLEVDKKIKLPFKRYFKKNELDLRLIDKAKKLVDNSSPIILELKLHYNRVRPYKLASKMNFERQLAFTIVPLKTANSPSYPSGHATQGRLMARYLADNVPMRHRMEIMKIGDYIGQSRMLGGVHYPSDTEFGQELGDALFKHLSLDKQVSESIIAIDDIILEAAMKKDDLFKRKNKSIFLDLVKSGDLLDTDGNKLQVKDTTQWNELKKELEDAEDKSGLPNWTLKNVRSVFGVALGGIEKTGNGMGRSSSGDPTGEDWEAGIAVGLYYIDNDGKLPLDSPEWERFEKYWGDWSEQAIKTAKEFQTKLKVKTIEQTGSRKVKGLSKEWKGTNTTPKTDLLSGNKRISLKKAGGSQLLSAGPSEAISTVEAAMRQFSASKAGKDKIDALLENLETKMIKLSTNDTISSINDLQDKDKKTLTAQDKKKIAEYELGDKFAKELTSEMENLFNSEQKMKDYFCWEAATGESKFGKGTWPTANEMVTFKEAGGISNHLQLYDPEKAGAILSDKNDFYVSFKSSSGSPPYLALRSKKVRLKNSFEPTFADIIQEECAKDRVGMKVLHESRMEELNEFQILSKIWNKTKSVAKSIADGAKKVLTAIHKRLSAAFNWIKKQGRRMLDAVLNFFGFTISKVKVKSGGKYPL